MAIKDLAVLVEDSPACRNRVRMALLMAHKYDAHLTAAYIRSADLLPRRVANLVPDSESLSASLEQAEQEKADRVARLFREEAERQGRGDAAHWLYLRGEPDTAAGVVGRYADLIIAGQLVRRDRFRPGVNPDEVVFTSGRPLLIIPDAFVPGDTLVEHAVLGWNGSREAARALADAMLILETHSRVSIVTVGERPASERRLGLDIQAHLQRHGVRAEHVTLAQDAADPGLELLRYAERSGAGLLVMGAYSHSRIREEVLGGATRSVLEQMTLPVLMAH